MLTILPSVLAADFLNLGADIIAAELAGAEMHHVDVMDGHFVPNISFGPVVVDVVAKVATKPLDVHLMISEPSKYLQDYLAVKPHNITIHAEIAEDVVAVLQAIRAGGSKAGLSIKPGTPFADVIPYLPYIDLLLIMTVEPGFGGQKFMADMVPKIAEAKAYFTEHRLDILLEVDGGVTKDTAPACIEAGATMLVAGSSFYNSSDYAQAYKDLIGA